MLLLLQVCNFGLIDRLELTFGAGLNVISGETGAGKSMLIDAMALVCGGRASDGQIRTGQEQASVDAVFDVSGHAALGEMLAGHGLAAPEQQLVISRQINLGGRNLCRINGRPVTTTLARDVAACLVDIHGQHEHQSLLQPAQHRVLLDAYGGADHLRLAAAARGQHARLKELRAELAALAGDARDRAQREDLLRFQLGEIESAELRCGEDEALRAERNLLANSEKLTAAAEAAYAALYEGGPGEGAAAAGRGDHLALSARDLLGRALGEFEAAAALDPRLDELREDLAGLVYSLEDLAHEVRRYREGLEFDPARLEEIQGRLELIHNLRRKYADTIEEILAYAAGARRQLDQLATGEQAAARLEEEIATAEAALGGAAAELAEARAGLGRRLAAETAGELRELGMRTAEFVVQLDRRPAAGGVLVGGQRVACGPHGVDEVSFLISPNPGEPPRSLAHSASGGEVSRIMLALKTVLARADRIPVVIFDEIDSGVGGRTANSVGLRLAGLGASRQVLCVTHLAQIAAFADRHFVVNKHAAGGRTVIAAGPVAGAARVEELARMLGGEAGAPAALGHARELLAASARDAGRDAPR